MVMAQQTFCDYTACRQPIDRRVPESAAVRVKFDATGTVMDADDGREPSAAIVLTVLGEYHDACLRDLVESRLLFGGRVDGLVRAAMREQYPLEDGIAAAAAPAGSTEDTADGEASELERCGTWINRRSGGEECRRPMPCALHSASPAVAS